MTSVLIRGRNQDKETGGLCIHTDDRARTQWEGSLLPAKGKASEPNPADTLNLDLQPPEL